MGSEFFETLFTAEIRDGIVHCTWPNGREICLPVRVFRQQHVRNSKVLAAYDAAKAPVVKFPRRGHQAAS